jgi:transcriptional regulator with PAS, ATPase and Fis domain
MGNRNRQSASALGTEFITVDPQLRSVLEMADKVALTDVPCLIQGESGTGKEVLARRIHHHSARAKKNLVSLNCGAIQESILLSELFGHEKGAFTGAFAQKQGLVEVADGGTLFLDEIAEMGLEAQAKLLRFLQDGESYRVGGKTPIRLNVRVLSATNKDPVQQIKAGKFREDLYYRINTVTLRVTPLRRRPHDIEPLIATFLKTGTQTQVTQFSEAALSLLKAYAWPGNVRELQNAVERFKILCDSATVTKDDVQNLLRLGEIVESPSAPSTDTFDLSQIEKLHILRVLAHFEGNKTKAANAMGITVKTLYNKLARYQEDQNPALN